MNFLTMIGRTENVKHRPGIVTMPLNDYRCITGEIMYSKSWFFLTVSFLLGLVSAFVVAYFTFDAKPVEVYDPGPTVKILVSKKEISRGAEIVAEAIVFEDAPVAELPEAALTNFSQVYRRRAAYPIPAGFPICEDFLLSQAESEEKENTYLPPGSRIVSLEVEQLRVGDLVSHLQVPITKYLSAEQKIDIRVVPHKEPKGLYVQRRQQLLRDHSIGGESPEDGEIVLQDVEVHQIVGETADEGIRQVQTLSLILDQEDAQKLMAAAKKGTLRVVPHVYELEFSGEPVAVDAVNIVTVESVLEFTAVETEASAEVMETGLTTAEPDVAMTEIEPIRNEVDSAETETVHTESVIPPALDTPVDEEMNLLALLQTIVDFSRDLGDQWSRTLPLVEPAHEEDAPQPVRQEKRDAVVSFVPPTIICSQQEEAVTRNDAEAPEETTKHPAGFQFIGSKKENGSAHLVPGYSPFDLRSRLPEQSKKENEETKESDKQEPVPFRNRASEPETDPHPLAERWQPKSL